MARWIFFIYVQCSLQSQMLLHSISWMTFKRFLMSDQNKNINSSLASLRNQWFQSFSIVFLFWKIFLVPQFVTIGLVNLHPLTDSIISTRFYSLFIRRTSVLQVKCLKYWKRFWIFLSLISYLSGKQTLTKLFLSFPTLLTVSLLLRRLICKTSTLIYLRKYVMIT